MKYCEQCGFKIDNDKFILCPMCGKVLKTQVEIRNYLLDDILYTNSNRRIYVSEKYKTESGDLNFNLINISLEDFLNKIKNLNGSLSCFSMYNLATETRGLVFNLYFYIKGYPNETRIVNIPKESFNIILNSYVDKSNDFFRRLKLNYAVMKEYADVYNNISDENKLLLENYKI